MRKTTLAVLLAMCMILSLCAACGSSGESAEDAVSVSEAFVVATPEPTAEPTPEPTEAPAEETPDATEAPAEPAVTDNAGAETDGQSTDSSGNSSSGNSNSGNSNSGTAASTPEPTPTPVQDKRSVAENMIGSSVSELVSAIGSPNSSSYTESCLVVGGQDGFLYYGSFTVNTIVRPDGSELVYDVY